MASRWTPGANPTSSSPSAPERLAPNPTRRPTTSANTARLAPRRIPSKRRHRRRRHGSYPTRPLRRRRPAPAASAFDSAAASFRGGRRRRAHEHHRTLPRDVRRRHRVGAASSTASVSIVPADSKATPRRRPIPGREVRRTGIRVNDWPTWRLDRMGASVYLLVREFATDGFGPRASRGFALGWVDCPRPMTRSAVRGGGTRPCISSPAAVGAFSAGVEATRAAASRGGPSRKRGTGPSRAKRRRARRRPRASADGRARTPEGGTERRARVQRGRQLEALPKRTRTDAGRNTPPRSGAGRKTSAGADAPPRGRGEEATRDRERETTTAPKMNLARGEGGGQGGAGRSLERPGSESRRQRFRTPGAVVAATMFW